MQQRTNIFLMVLFATVTISLWAFFNRPHQEPVWPQRIQGFSFSPFHAEQDAVQGVFPSIEQIDHDLSLLAGKTNAVRTYSVDDNLVEVPRLAKAHGINVALGAWIDARLDHNNSQVETVISLAHQHRNIVRLVVGNEVLLRGDIPKPLLMTYLDRVREEVGQPVSTAEPWHVWMKHPELAEHVDYLAVHMLPYWEEVEVGASIDYIVEKINLLKKTFPNKPIVIAEVGWPSNGRARGYAVASPTNEALFLRRFLARAAQEKYIYYVMEAFDQPWKSQTEGSVGAYWGVYDVERQEKFTFTDPLEAIPQWRVLAVMSVLVAMATLGLLFLDGRTLRKRGRSFLAVVAYAIATTVVWAIYDYSQQYFSIKSVIVGILLFSAMIGLIIVLLAEAHEWAEAHWVEKRRRPLELRAPTKALPKVSIHVPAYNEPPEMLKETLLALSQLDYPDFEVLMIDNNTKDPAVWQPIEAYCASLGPRFRFFHVEPLAGYKAGALNFGLRETAADAEIIAVIDSDYVVDPAWLRDLVPQFEDEKIAIVQAPQDYRDAHESAFKAMCYAEYRGFFYIGMVTRNERNAIIQHGTMTMIRKSTLQSSGAWAEWCITEDAELGLRVFEQGSQALYIPRSYGKGVMPDTFLDFKKQRFRWAFGSMQIMRGHFRELFGLRSTSLTAGQRYHFIAGWLPWLADGLNLLFNCGALYWSLAMIYAPTQIDPPAVSFLALPLVVFCFKMVKLVHLYRTCVRVSYWQTLLAGIAGLALSHAIARAVLQGVVSKSEAFFRTPKRADGMNVFRALAAAREEALLFIALALAAIAISMTAPAGSLEISIWVAVLWVQTVPYAASVVLSLVSAGRAEAKSV